MKPEPPTAVREAVREDGRRRRNDLEPRLVDPLATSCEHDHGRSEGACRHTAQDSVADLLGDEPRRFAAAEGARVCLGQREGDEEQRYADPVVQAALDVQPLANAYGEAGEGDDRLPERRVRRRQDDGEEQHLGGRERPPEENETCRATGNDRERQPDAEQQRGDRHLVSERLEVDAGRVAEEDDRQGRLREQLDGLARDVRFDQAEGVRAQEQADRREDDRGGDRRPLEPAGDGREAEQRERDRGQGPVHRQTLSRPACDQASPSRPIALASLRIAIHSANSGSTISRFLSTLSISAVASRRGSAHLTASAVRSSRRSTAAR